MVSSLGPKGELPQCVAGDLSLFLTVHSTSFGSGLTFPIFMGPSLPVSLHAKCLGISDCSSPRIGSPGPLPSPPTQVVAEQAVATSPAAVFSPPVLGGLAGLRQLPLLAGRWR